MCLELGQTGWQMVCTSQQPFELRTCSSWPKYIFSYKPANINMPKKYTKPYRLGSDVCAEEAVTHEAPVGVTG